MALSAFRVSASDLAVSIMVAADCSILDVLPHAAEVVSQNLSPRHRIVSLNSAPVKDRCELRQLLNSFAPSAIVEVGFTCMLEHGKRVEIADSVECNGSVSTMAPQSSAFGDSDEEVEPAMVSPVSASNTLAASTRGLDDFHPDVGDFSAQGDDGVSGFFAARDSPRLLAFDAVEGMDATVRAKESKEIRNATIRQKLFRALNKVRPGFCVICVCQEVNPLAELELLGLQTKHALTVIELGIKLRHRPTPQVVSQKLGDCMRAGGWLVVVNAQKSINTMRHIDQMVDEMRTNNLAGVHPDARIIVCTEPHPHFPARLTEGAVMTKIHTSFSHSSLMSMTAASMTSTTCCRLVIGAYLQGDEGGVPTVGNRSLTALNSSRSGAKADLSSSSSSPKKRRVKLSAAVDIVDIEPREVFQTASCGPGKSQSGRPIDVSGSVALRHTFAGIMNDKFLCIKPAGDRGRYAVGSSLGNVYYLDNAGNSMLQVHAHDACIWDVSFNSKYEFATGCEDGSAIQWSFLSDAATEGPTDEDDDAHGSLDQRSSSLLGADVYCVSYLHQRDDCTAPLVTGGLVNHLLVHPNTRQPPVPQDGSEGFLVDTPSNCQVLSAFPSSNNVLVGGGDGSLSIVHVDHAAGSVVRVLNDHTRKVPTVSVRNENAFFSGSFDSTIRAWDHRESSTHATHTLKLKNYVTGLCVDDVHLAASVGENLYLWDVRKLNEVLGGFPQGWKGLSRGIALDSANHLVITASPDGLVRFWNFV